MRKHVGHKKRKGPRRIIKPVKITDGASAAAAGIRAGTQYPTKTPRGKAVPEIYVKGPDGEYHKAHLRGREKTLKNLYGSVKVSTYLYLSWREGDTVKEYYLGKIGE